MPHARRDLSLRNAVAAEPVRDDLAALVLEARQQALEEAFGGSGIPVLLHQDVEHNTVLVHSAPEIEELAVVSRYTSSMCQMSPGFGRRLRSLAAGFAPKRRHHRLMLS